MRIFNCLCLLIILTGCQAEYKDISDNEENRGVIQQRFETLQVLKVHGVALEKHGKNIDGYTITKEPGFAGPEVITKRDFPIGSIIQISKVLMCTNCLPSSVEFELNVVSEKLKVDVPVRLVGVHFKDVETGQLKLEAGFFRKIN